MSTLRCTSMVILAAMALLYSSHAGEAAGGAKDAAAGAEEGDVVIRKEGVSPPGAKIVRDDYIYVVFRRGTEVKVPSFQVKEVIYSDADANYHEAVKKREEGRYTTAALYFQKSLDNLGNSKWAAEYCNYGIADAFYEAGIFTGYTGKTTGTKYAPASVYFKKALEANPSGKSRFMPDIVVKLPICLAEEGKLDEAEKAMKDAEERIKAYRDEAIKIGSGYSEIADRASAQLAVADARISQKKAGSKISHEVLDKWQSARTKCMKFPELLSDAVDGVLMYLIALKDYNTALSESQSIIDRYQRENDPALLPLMPSAYTAHGKANLALAVESEGKGQKMQAQAAYADARWDFQYVVAQFFDNDDYLASAHFYAGLCYEKRKEVEADAHDKAIREWKLVVKQFPKSSFRDAAAKELGNVGVKVEDDVPAAAAPAAPAAQAPAGDQPKPDPKAKPAKKDAKPK